MRPPTEIFSLPVGDASTLLCALQDPSEYQRHQNPTVPRVLAWRLDTAGDDTIALSPNEALALVMAARRGVRRAHGVAVMRALARIALMIVTLAACGAAY